MIYFTVAFIVTSFFIIRKLTDIDTALRNTNRNMKSLTTVAENQQIAYRTYEVPYLQLAHTDLARVCKTENDVNNLSNEEKMEKIFNAECRMREQHIQQLTMAILQTYHFDMPVLEARARAEGIVTQLDQSVMPPTEEPMGETISEVQSQNPNGPFQ